MLTRDAITNLKANIAVENMVTKMYSAQAPEVQDAGLQKLLTRIRDQEIYHEEVFTYLLAEAKEAAEADRALAAKPEEAKPRCIPSVGSLKD